MLILIDVKFPSLPVCFTKSLGYKGMFSLADILTK